MVLFRPRALKILCFVSLRSRGITASLRPVNPDNPDRKYYLNAGARCAMKSGQVQPAGISEATNQSNGSAPSEHP